MEGLVHAFQDSKWLECDESDYTWTGLDPDTAYNFQIVAYDTFDREDVDSMEVTTEAEPDDSAGPVSPMIMLAGAIALGIGVAAVIALALRKRKPQQPEPPRQQYPPQPPQQPPQYPPG